MRENRPAKCRGELPKRRFRALSRRTDVDRERIAPSPPTQTGQAVFPHPAFQFVVADGLAQALDSGLSEESHQPHGLAPRSLVLQAVHCQVGVVPQARFSGASGRTGLRHCPDPAMGKLSSAGRILFGLFFFHLEAVFFFFSFFVFALTEFGSPSPAVLRCQ